MFGHATHLNGRGSVVRIAEVVGLVAEPAAQVLAVGEKASRGSTNVLVHRLYPPIRPLHKKLGVKETLNSQNDTISATYTDGHSAYCESG